MSSPTQIKYSSSDPDSRYADYIRRQRAILLGISLVGCTRGQAEN